MTTANIARRAKRRKDDCVCNDIVVEQILLKTRQLFIYEEINGALAKKVTKNLLALDTVNNLPILIWINSYGGTITDGWSIIDTMYSLSSSVVTIINGAACSMAGVVALAGEKRLISEHSTWMGHDVSCGKWDYAANFAAYATYIGKLKAQLMAFIEEKTTLSKEEMSQIKTSELWLNAEECQAKGIVDGILTEEGLILEEDENPEGTTTAV